MSEIFTGVKLPGNKDPGLSDYGKKTREEMIALYRSYAAYSKECAERVLAAPDDAFEVRIYRGSHVQHLVKVLGPGDVA
jgi:hypothetical protein